MRRLNLLRQLLYTASISDVLKLSPSTRHLAATLNIENSRRRWPELLPMPSRELLRLAGYKQSRYSKQLIERFNTEGREAGLFSLSVGEPTVYRITDLTKRHLTAAIAKAAAKLADSLPTPLACSLADAPNASCNGGDLEPRNERNDSNDSNDGHGQSNGRCKTGVPSTAEAERLLRDLSELGL